MPQPVSDTSRHTYMPSCKLNIEWAFVKYARSHRIMQVLMVRVPFLSPIASNAFIIRFIMTCSICVISPEIRGISSKKSHIKWILSFAEMHSKSIVSLATFVKSTGFNGVSFLLEKTIKCSVRLVARSIADFISRILSKDGDSGGISIKARSRFPLIIISRLLKSWAIPPASMPRLSSFCVFWTCISKFFCSVISREIPHVPIILCFSL